jgi:tRNA-2-methylthio-N6-dimethylallyladenosine synthase
MPDPVPPELREERHGRLLELVNQIGARRYAEFIGRRTQVLVEGPSKKNPARFTGRTGCNRIAVFDGAERDRGGLMDLRITGAGSFTLYGEPVIGNPG